MRIFLRIINSRSHAFNSNVWIDRFIVTKIKIDICKIQYAKDLTIYWMKCLHANLLCVMIHSLFFSHLIVMSKHTIRMCHDSSLRYATLYNLFWDCRYFHIIFESKQIYSNFDLIFIFQSIFQVLSREYLNTEKLWKNGFLSL